MWAVAPSCWKVFSHYLHKKKSTRISPRYLSECNVSKKRMGPITVKTLKIWIGWRGLAKHMIVLKDKKKLRTPINGKFNEIGCADLVYKYLCIP
jgi:hypothetical protein